MTSEHPARPPLPELARAAIAMIVLAVIAAHVVVAVVTPYEFHRDEFLYFAMGRNLSLFGMDFPPFIAVLSELQRAAFGDAIWSLRLGPALAHGAIVLLAALTAHRLGGGAFAQLLAMVAAATAPLFLRAASLFQPVAFDQLWWTIALYALIRVADDTSAAAGTPVRGAAPDAGPRQVRHWILFGVACGIGLFTKFSILILGAAAFIAILVTRPRWLRTREPWIAAAIALLIGAPSLIGQIRLGFPLFDQMATLRAGQLDRITYGQFIVELVLMHGPAAFLLAVVGAGALIGSRRFARWRVVGWTALFSVLVIMGLRGKPYYAGPVFPVLYAAGAVIVATQISRVRSITLAHAIRAGVAIAIAAWSISLLPLALPAFSPERTARVAAAVGITSVVTTNQGVVMELPQDYADMLGWERKVARIAEAYHALPPADREEAVIVTANYGQAGAVDFYGPRFGLPRARAPIGSYWFWGPGDKPGDVVIKVGGDRDDLNDYCGDVTLATRIDEPWVVPEERDLAIWICRRLPFTLQEIWPQFRGQN